MRFFLKAFLSFHILNGFYAYELPGPFSVTVTKQAWAPTEYLHQVLHRRKATQTNKQTNKQDRVSHAQEAHDQAEKIKHGTEMVEVCFYWVKTCLSQQVQITLEFWKKMMPSYTEIFTQVKYDSWYNIALHLCSCYFLCLECLCPPSSSDEILPLT